MNRIRFCTVMTLALAAGPLAAQEPLAIKGGRILPVSGPPIESGTVLIRDGKIAAVGKDVAVPAGVKVIDATGKVVVPGYVEIHSSRGMDQPNETNPNVPFLSVMDSIDPIQEYFEECRRNGITSAAIVPGNNTMLGGQAVVLKTAGGFISDMVYKKGVGIKISLRPVGDHNRMGQIAALRKEFDAAKGAMTTTPPEAGAPQDNAPANREGVRGRGPANGDAAAAQDTQTQRRGQRGGARGGAATGPMAGDEALVRAALQKLLKGEALAYIYCELAMDVPQALKLVQDYKLKGVLVLGQDCYKAVKLIAASKLPVVLDANMVYWETDPRTGEERQIVLPKIYRDAGVNVMYQTGGAAGGGGGRGGGGAPPMIGTNYLWYQAATAVKYGTPVDEAMKAVTLQPAQVLGVDKQVGSIEVGKDADVTILTGDPLKFDTWVQTTIVGGKVVYERDKDHKLQKLLKPDGK